MGASWLSKHVLFVGKEFVDAVLWIGGIFVLGFFIVYGNVMTLMVEEFTSGGKRDSEPYSLLPSVAESNRMGSPASSPSSSAGSMPAHSVAMVTDRFHAPTMERYLQDRLALYTTPFSLLPPGKHLRIHRLGVDAPVVDVAYASETQMEQGAFHDQLLQGVVKYPFTSEPGTTGNTLVFGHSSVDFWETKTNPYGFIFSHLNELEVGDTIELVRNSKQYLYSVEETVIKNPTEINEVLQQFDQGKFLTLMACYPRFSTAQRILVVAKEISSEAYAKKHLVTTKQTLIN